MEAPKGPLTLIFGCDHAGFPLKELLLPYYRGQSILTEDVGTHSLDCVDYPLYAAALAQALHKNPQALGVLICGSGIGVSIAANRYPFIRAALCVSAAHARLARAHNNANVLCLGARLTPVEEAKATTDAFIKTPFEGGRHTKRVEMLSHMPAEDKNPTGEQFISLA
jgi:ribose 5-phosphate isomerase B